MIQKNMQVDLETWEKLKEISFLKKEPMSRIIRNVVENLYKDIKSKKIKEKNE